MAESCLKATCSRSPHEAQGRYPAQECLQGDLQFQPGQMLSDALVDAVSEGDVVVLRPVEVHPPWVLEAFGVVVGTGEESDDAVVGGYHPAGELDVLGGHAQGDGVGDGQDAQEFVDGTGHQ